MFGGTYIFPKNFYIDLMYGFYFNETINKHEILFNFNFESKDWYLAFRQNLKFAPKFFCRNKLYLFNILFSNGYNISVNSALGFETGKKVSYAMWIKTYLALFPIIGPEIGLTFAIEQSLFNFGVLIGLKLNLPIFYIIAYWQPYFISKLGYQDLGFALILKL